MIIHQNFPDLPRPSHVSQINWPEQQCYILINLDLIQIFKAIFERKEGWFCIKYNMLLDETWERTCLENVQAINLHYPLYRTDVGNVIIDRPSLSLIPLSSDLWHSQSQSMIREVGILFIQLYVVSFKRAFCLYSPKILLHVSVHFAANSVYFCHQNSFLLEKLSIKSSCSNEVSMEGHDESSRFRLGSNSLCG